ncbi:YkyB family protein [Sporosarcina sp. YIM B06819]|uniref:YkyB family protein n=1 Tax=Sporosarcina sp. YIM B06819 TaxID=3081769 RepID=UPI00298D2D2E|nr:YkyB family protein [Sporosarcina sp. YIM B06819]
MKNNQSIRQLAIAIYTINRHAKTAPDNKQLYSLKKMAIEKLLRSGNAEKVGLHFVDNPKFSKQHSTVLVRCDDFLFHTIPEKEDFNTLPHLGQQDPASRNPQERMSLKTARELLSTYVDPPQPIPVVKKKTKVVQKKSIHNIQNSQNFRSSYLDGK